LYINKWQLECSLFLSSLEWSLFCSSMGFGTKEQEAETGACLFALDEEHRGLGVGLFCGLCLGRVGVEAVASCILRVY
jgi:hypothetical protein